MDRGAEHPGLPPALSVGVDDDVGGHDDAPGPHARFDDYQIHDRIGAGAMGAVYRATQRSTNRTVALKIIRGAAVHSGRALQRFAREVEVAARLDHPHIAQIYHSGLHRDHYFYAMRLVDGTHLNRYVRDRALDDRAILELFRDICAAVEHAHQRGVIHRDLKPSNILVDEAGRPTIVDFGLAKPTADQPDMPALSIDGEVVGTLEYMSPEQAGGRATQVDVRTDIYALGAVLFELLTGDLPHPRLPNRFDYQQQIVAAEARRARSVRPDLDADLEAILARCLAHDRDARYASVGELAADLDAFLNHQPIRARALTLPYFVGKWARRHRLRLIVGLAAAVALIAAGGYVYGLLSAERARTVLQRDLAERSHYANLIRQADEAIREQRFGEAQQLLARCPEPLRRWEWGWLSRRADNSRLAVDLSEADPTGLAFTTEGGLAVVAQSGAELQITPDGAVRTTGQASGRPAFLAPVIAPDGRARAYRLPDGSVRVSRQDGSPVDLAIPEGARLHGPLRLTAAPHALFAQTRDQELMRIDVATGERRVIARVDGHMIACSPDGRFIALSVDAGVLLLDRAGQAVLTVMGRTGGRRMAAFSGDSTAAVVMDGPADVMLINLASARATPMPVLLRGEATSLALDERATAVAIGLSNGAVEVRPTIADGPVGHLSGPAVGVIDLAFSQDGQRLAALAGDHRLHVWDLPSDTTQPSRPTDRPASPGSGTVAADGRYALATADGRLVVGGPTGEPRVVPVPSTDIMTLTLVGSAPDAAVVSRTDGSLAVQPLDGGASGASVRLEQAAWQLAASPDGRRLAAQTGDTIRLFSLPDLVAEADIPHCVRPVWMADGSLLAVRTPGDAPPTLVRWVSGGRPARDVCALEDPGQDPVGLAVCPDRSRAAVVYARGAIDLIDLRAGRRTARLSSSPRQTLRRIAFSERGDRLLCVDDRLRLFDVVTGQELIAFDQIEPPLVALQPVFGRTIALIDDDGLRRFDAPGRGD